MSVIDTLIFDRTQYDITNDTDKAYIDYNDLNRVEEAVKYLSDILFKYNYINRVNIKTWSIDEFRKQEDCERIKENFNILKEAYFYKFETPDFKWEDIEEANEIERILYNTHLIIKGMEESFIHSGVAQCGQNRMWQNRFRRY